MWPYFECDKGVYEYVTWILSIWYVYDIIQVIMCVCVWLDPIFLSNMQHDSIKVNICDWSEHCMYSYVLCHSKQNMSFQTNVGMAIHNTCIQLVFRQDYNFSDIGCSYHQNKFKASIEMYIDRNMFCLFSGLSWNRDSTTVIH